MEETVFQEQFQALQEALRGYGRVAVAFSGGVDSTLLLRVALETLGAEQVLALIGASVLVPELELAEARALAEALGARYRVVETDALADARVAANPADRCYYCKMNLFSTFRTLAAEQGFTVLLDGANADDTGDWRPGQRAARELDVQSPLMAVGMGKAGIRALSRHYHLPTAEKPSYACLASRIPYGTPLSPAILAMVEQAEVVLRDAGFVQCRVRHHGELARIEVTEADMPHMLDTELRMHITTQLRAIGYRYITLDLQGYRTGSMNEVL